MPARDVAAEFVQLAFQVDRHLPGSVDAYFGPPELMTQALAGAAPPPAALAETADELAQTIAADPALASDRGAYLGAQLGALRTTIDILHGHAPTLVAEVQRLFDVSPAWVDESVFAAAHELLNDVLPGAAPLPERVQSFRARSRVPADIAVALIHRLLDDFRARTARLVALPPGEQCEIVLVADEPWMAFNHFLGDSRSRIDFNQDHPFEIRNIVETVAHEAYPGHHTELCLKEAGLYRGQGRLEHALTLANSPAMLVSEGIAKNALAAIVAEAEMTALLKDCYAQAGLPAGDAERAEAVAQAYQQLDRVADNQVLLLYRDGAPPDAVMAYGLRYALTSPDDEASYLRFYQDPSSRSYIYNYTLGRELVAAYLERAADRQQAFGPLLSEPVIPSQLRVPVATQP